MTANMLYNAYDVNITSFEFKIKDWIITLCILYCTIKHFGALIRMSNISSSRKYKVVSYVVKEELHPWDIELSLKQTVKVLVVGLFIGESVLHVCLLQLLYTYIITCSVNLQLFWHCTLYAYNTKYQKAL